MACVDFFRPPFHDTQRECDDLSCPFLSPLLCLLSRAVGVGDDWADGGIVLLCRVVAEWDEESAQEFLAFDGEHGGVLAAVEVIAHFERTFRPVRRAEVLRQHGHGQGRVVLYGIVEGDVRHIPRHVYLVVAEMITKALDAVEVCHWFSHDAERRVGQAVECHARQGDVVVHDELFFCPH